MILFFAGSESFRKELKEAGAKNVLTSFYYQKKGLKELKNDFENIFIDSGGFTARKNNIEINLKEYGDFLKENKDYIFTAANLDVNNLETQLENQKYLEQIYPILPVYHYAEYSQKRYDLFENYCKNYKYVAVGGVAGQNLSKNRMINYLNFCFKTSLKYKTKIHGFGMASLELLKNYPFYSTDSTTWIQPGRFGTCILYNGLETKRFHYKDKKLYTGSKMIGGNDYYFRLIQCVKEYLKIEKDITKLWEKRGIKWL